MEEDQVLDAGEVKGFTIRCKGDNNVYEDVVVSDADAQVMANNCEYFQNVFAHGTREAEERVILKPDWASSTAKQLVQLLTTGNITVRSRERESIFLLEEAAQQVLLNISFHVPAFVAKGPHASILNRTQVGSFLNLCKLLNRTADIQITFTRCSGTCVRSITEEQLSGPEVEVEFPPDLLKISTVDKSVSVDGWLTLLAQGIVIKESDESSSSSQVISETSPPEEQLSRLARILRISRSAAKETRYHLQAFTSATSIGTVLNAMCQILHRHRAESADVRVYSQEEFSLRLPCRFVLEKALEKTANSLSRHGLKVYLHQGNRLGYFLGGSSSFNLCPTITGTLPQIQAVLSVIPEEWMQTYSKSTRDSALKWCSLRVCAPRVETLDRLAIAVGACKNNPNTLGVDVRSKAFFAVKSVNDMKLLLAAMINGGGVGEDSADKVPTLLILEQPKGIF